MDSIDRVNASNAAEEAALLAIVQGRTYEAAAADETGRRCAQCFFPLREGFDVVEVPSDPLPTEGDMVEVASVLYCSLLCSPPPGTYRRVA